MFVQIVCRFALVCVIAVSSQASCGDFRPINDRYLDSETACENYPRVSSYRGSDVEFGGLEVTPYEYPGSEIVAEEVFGSYPSSEFSSASQIAPRVNSAVECSGIYGVSSCGPEPTIEPIRSLPKLVLTPTNGPIVPLPCAPAPLPRVIANKCSCTKTVLKPQLYQRIIQVQKNQRFLKKTYKPVVEKVAYSARPRC